MKNTKSVKIKELQLGQVVNFFGDTYGWGTVIQVTDEIVKVIRPYIHIGDFSYSGNQVLNYIGTETVTLSREDNRMIDVSLDKVPTIK